LQLLLNKIDILRQDDNVLYVQLWDQNQQYEIHPLDGAGVANRWFFINGKSDTVYICHLIEDAIFAHMITGSMTFASVSQNNLSATVDYVRKNNSNNKIVIVAGKESREVAMETASANECKVVYSDFEGEIELMQYALSKEYEPYGPLPRVKSFAVGLMPNGLGDWVKDVAHRIQCPLDYVAIPTMISVGSLLQGKVSIHPKAKDDWKMIPNLWGGVVGRPSTMKSPAVETSLQFFYDLQKSEDRKFQVASEVYGRSYGRWERKRRHLEKKLDQAEQGGDPAKIQAAETTLDQWDARQPTKPKAKRLLVNDTTVEKIGELLADNPQGLLLYRDELSGWLNSLEDESRAEGRKFYLSSFNGGQPYSYDRISRGTVRIPSNTLSIMGGIQPDALQAFMLRNSSGQKNDGLIQRLQLTVWPDEVGFNFVDQEPDANAEHKAKAIYEQIYAFDVAEEPLRFTPDAQQLWDEFYVNLQHEIQAPDLHPAVAAHLGKFGGLCASLALIIGVIEDGLVPVGKGAVDRALGWIAYLRSHMEKVYAPVLKPAEYVGRRILAKKYKLPSGFTEYELGRKQWSGITDPGVIAEALEDLIVRGYLRPKQKTGVGRRTTEYTWTF
jgi:hypothetical protein